MKKTDTKSLAVLALFTAIIIVMAFTPIGYIQLPLVKATLIHVPVIIGSVMLGYKKGAYLGFLFGLTSFINNTLTPSALSFAFTPLIPVYGTEEGSLWALVICFGPRVLVGIVPHFVYKGFNALTGGKARPAVFAAAAVAGSMTNTLLVMNGIYLVFMDAYALLKDVPISAVYGLAMSVVLINGLPEAVIAAVAAGGVLTALMNNKRPNEIIKK